FGALIGYTRGRTIDGDEMSFVANHIYLPAPGWVSETRAQFSYYDLAAIPNDPNGPELNITGFGYFGRDTFQPFNVWERHSQFQQNVSFTAGRHHLKFGVDANPIRDHVRSQTFFGGRFAFGQVVPLSAVINSATGDPNYS